MKQQQSDIFNKDDKDKSRVGKCTSPDYADALAPQGVKAACLIAKLKIKFGSFIEAQGDLHSVPRHKRGRTGRRGLSSGSILGEG